MDDFTLTKAQSEAIADAALQDFADSINRASCFDASASVDDLIDRRLGDYGCPSDALATWRARIREWPFRGFR